MIPILVYDIFLLKTDEARTEHSNISVYTTKSSTKTVFIRYNNL